MIELPASDWRTTAVEDPEPSLRKPVMAGLIVIGLVFGGFGAWAFMASLDSAAVAMGSVVADSRRKTVQHLEGGIVKGLNVREGDEVAAGQVLLALDPTQADAVLGQVRGQYWSALARLARLRAEQDGAALIFPAELQRERHNPAVADILRSQARVFAARHEMREGVIAVREKRISQIREEIAALQAQLLAAEEHLSYTVDELDSVERLFKKGFERKPRLLELKRAAADLEGKRGEFAARIARAEQEIAATELEIISQKSTHASETAAELDDAQALVADLADRLRAAEDVRARTQVVAPQDGVVVDLKVFTVGGVVSPGMPLLDIVPKDDPLIVQARVNPLDIEAVRVGQPANVHLVSYKQRQVPTIAGKVTHVSADQLSDPRTGEAFFVAHVVLDAEALAEAKQVSLAPGMPAEVFITTGERKAIDYLISPVRDSMRRAFREE